MQSSLKKSLYLGLAALSFASVASVTANSSNANAAKKHAAAKKVTYTTDNKKLDQTVTFKATGKNAVYNKAVGKRSVVKNGSLNDMKSKANSNNTNDLFMAYQEGHTSKGVHYYKVVSFDKKVRGFVYNKGVAKTNTKVATDKPSNAVGYLNNTKRFFNEPYGSQFKTSVKNDYNGMNLDNDQFTVEDAVKVNNGQTYYYVKDNANQLVNGWVHSSYFQNNITPAAQKNADAAKAVHVKFVDAANLGALVTTADVQPHDGAYDKGAQNYTNDQFTAALKKQLLNSGYTLDGNAKGQTPKQGDTVTVLVNKNSTSDVLPATFKFQGLKVNNNTGLQVNDDQTIDLKNIPSLSTDQQNELKGFTNDTFDMNKIVNDIFASGKVWNVIKQGNTTYTFDKDATMNAYNGNSNLGNNGKNTVTFNDVYNHQITLYYNKSVNNSTDSKSTDNGNSQFTTPGDQQTATANVNKAVNTFKANNFDLSKVVGSNGQQYTQKSDLLKDITTSQLNSNDVNNLKGIANLGFGNSILANVASKVNNGSIKSAYISKSGTDLYLHYVKNDNDFQNDQGNSQGSKPLSNNYADKLSDNFHSDFLNLDFNNSDVSALLTSMSNISKINIASDGSITKN